MNTTTYPRQQYRSHPVDRMMRQTNTAELGPVRDEVEAILGSHVLTAVIEEDLQTLAAMKHVDGLVAFLCTLLKDGKVISQGRGSAVLGPNSKFIKRTVASAFNSALADASIRATKVLGTFLGAPSELYEPQDEQATEKQREYLRQLVHMNVEDEGDRETWELQIPELTKAEASKAIESFRR